MSTAKTKVNQEQLQGFFVDHLHIPEPHYQTVEEGELSQAYFYDSPEGERVLRINADMKDGFEKDAYAADHFSSYGVPIPRVLEVGELSSGLFFSISEKVPGKVIDKFDNDEIQGFMPDFMQVLDVIHNIPPSGEGYGYWRTDGSGKYASWHEAVLDGLVDNEDERLADVNFFDRGLHDELKVRVEKLLDGCPNERRLIHNDYGFSNVLSDGVHITGVIDWHSSAYGDPRVLGL